MTLSKRLDALEQIAEDCRRREHRELLGAEITRRHAAAGLVVSPEQLDAKVERALALSEHMVLLAASGLSLEAIARRVAIEHDLNPATVLATFKALQAERRG